MFTYILVASALLSSWLAHLKWDPNQEGSENAEVLPMPQWLHTHTHTRNTEKSCTEEPISSRLQLSLATQLKILLKPLEKSPFWGRETLLVKHICIGGLPWHLHVHKHMVSQNQLYQGFAAFLLQTTNNHQLVLTVSREPLHPHGIPVSPSTDQDSTDSHSTVPGQRWESTPTCASAGTEISGSSFWICSRGFSTLGKNTSVPNPWQEPYFWLLLFIVDGRAPWCTQVFVSCKSRALRSQPVPHL